jgi:hypothetical protein
MCVVFSFRLKVILYYSYAMLCVTHLVLLAFETMMLAEGAEREGSLLFSLVSVTVSFPSLLYRQSNTMF